MGSKLDRYEPYVEDVEQDGSCLGSIIARRLQYNLNHVGWKLDCDGLSHTDPKFLVNVSGVRSGLLIFLFLQSSEMILSYRRGNKAPHSQGSAQSAWERLLDQGGLS